MGPVHLDLWVLLDQNVNIVLEGLAVAAGVANGREKDVCSEFTV